ncbi:hypothetical protein D3C84_1013490 [compost metagenome]
MTAERVQLKTLGPQCLHPQTPLQQVHLKRQRLGLGRIVEHFQLMSILGHDPRLQLCGQRGLGRILGIGGLCQHLLFQRMNRRFAGFAPGLAHLMLALFIRTDRDVPQQQWQGNARGDQ